MWQGHACSRVLPESISEIAAVALSWPDGAIQRHGGLSDCGAEDCAILCVCVVAVQRALEVEKRISNLCMKHVNIRKLMKILANAWCRSKWLVLFLIMTREFGNCTTLHGRTHGHYSFFFIWVKVLMTDTLRLYKAPPNWQLTLKFNVSNELKSSTSLSLAGC